MVQPPDHARAATSSATPIQVFTSVLVLVQDDPFVARAQNVTIDSAELGAIASIPAHAHLRSLVLFKTHMALVIAILAHGATFEASSGTFAVCFAAEILFRHRTGEKLSSQVGLEVGEIERGVANGKFG